jgi:hypothetical protein
MKKYLLAIALLLLSCSDSFAWYIGIPGFGSGNGHASPTYTALGDSWTMPLSDPSGAKANLKWSYLTGQGLGASWYSRGVSGAMACDISDLQTFKYTIPNSTDTQLFTVEAGINDANTKRLGTYEAVYSACLTAAVTYLSIPDTSKLYVNTTNCTPTGTWVADTGYANNPYYSNTSGSTETCTITTNGGPLYIWYGLNDAWNGTMTYNVDGAGAVSVSTKTSPLIATQNSGTRGQAVAKITGLSSGSHTVVFTVTSSGSTNYAEPIAIGTTPTSYTSTMPKVIIAGVPKQRSDANAADTAAYNTDAMAVYTAALADGLPVSFADFRSYIDPVSDMGDSLHLNTAGHLHVSTGVLAVANPLFSTMNVSGVTGGGTGSSLWNRALKAISMGQIDFPTNDTLSSSILIGRRALSSYGLGGTITSSYNTVIGYEALSNAPFSPPPTSITVVGAQALQNYGSSNTVAIGYKAGQNSVSGSGLTLVGAAAGNSITTGAINTIIGGSVGSVTLQTGAGNILIGTGSSVDTDISTRNYDLNIGNTVSGDIQKTNGAVGGTLFGGAALATNATQGFIYIHNMAGTPTGVPTAYTGFSPMIYDTTNDKICVYNGTWKCSASLL